MEVAKIDEPKLKMRKVDSFFKSEKQSLGQLVSQLTAIDVLTFNQIATSKRLRRAFKADGYDLPRSHKKVRDLLMKQREDIVKTIRGELNAIKLRDGRFSITFDKSTFMINRWYMNINVYFQGSFHSLGMIGSLNAAQAIKLVEERLQLFGLDLNKDVVATVKDGASLMVKFGKETCPEHVTCYAHAIHLAVCDVLYKKHITSRVKISFVLWMIEKVTPKTTLLLKVKIILRRNKGISLFLWHLTYKIWCKKFEKL